MLCGQSFRDHKAEQEMGLLPLYHRRHSIHAKVRGIHTHLSLSIQAGIVTFQGQFSVKLKHSRRAQSRASKGVRSGEEGCGLEKGSRARWRGVKGCFWPLGRKFSTPGVDYLRKQSTLKQNGAEMTSQNPPPYSWAKTLERTFLQEKNYSNFYSWLGSSLALTLAQLLCWKADNNSASSILAWSKGGSTHEGGGVQRVTC